MPLPFAPNPNLERIAQHPQHSAENKRVLLPAPPTSQEFIFKNTSVNASHTFNVNSQWKFFSVTVVVTLSSTWASQWKRRLDKHFHVVNRPMGGVFMEQSQSQHRLPELGDKSKFCFQFHFVPWFLFLLSSLSGKS